MLSYKGVTWMIKTYKERIRDLREDNDLTQKEIAEVLGIKYNVYQRYELGTSKMPIHHLITLAEYYNTSTDYILGRTNEKNPYPKAK